MGQISCKDQLKNPNPSLYSEELWEEARGECSFFKSSQALIIFRLTCSLSAISVFLVIYIILRSPTKLSTIYHRITLAMAICQMISSFPRALSTLPLPAPGDYWTDILNVQGTRLGNTFTCTLQGFLIRFGDLSAGSYFLMGLTFYYTCAIGFEMKVKTLTKFIEPLIHIFCISLGLLTSLPPLFVGGYNVSSDDYFTMSCTVAPKPWFCDRKNSTVACVRGGVKMGKGLPTDKKVISYDPYIFSFSLLCLLIVCYKVYKKDREMAALLKNFDIDKNGRRLLNRNPHGQSVKHIRLTKEVYRLRNGEEISLQEVQRRAKDLYKDTKVIASQTVLYFSLMLIIGACEICFNYSIGNTYFIGFLAVIWTMQGLYQLLIFVFHKVFNQRRHDPDISTTDAIIEIFRGESGNEAFIISGIHAVKMMNKEMGSSICSDYFDEKEEDESSLLVSSCGLTGNFGSVALTTGGGLSFKSYSTELDDKSNMQSKCTVNDDSSSRIHRYSTGGDDGLSRFSEENWTTGAADLSVFSEEVSNSCGSSISLSSFGATQSEKF